MKSIKGYWKFGSSKISKWKKFLDQTIFKWGCFLQNTLFCNISKYDAKFSLLLQIQELALKLNLSDGEANSSA